MKFSCLAILVMSFCFSSANIYAESLSLSASVSASVCPPEEVSQTICNGDLYRCGYSTTTTCNGETVNCTCI